MNRLAVTGNPRHGTSFSMGTGRSIKNVISRRTVLMGAAAFLLAGCGKDSTPQTLPAGPATTGTPTPSSDAWLGATIEPSLAPAWTDADGYIHSAVAASGVFVNNTVEIPTTATNPDIRRWVLAMEDTIPFDANTIATKIQAILDDPRSWRWDGRVAFSLIADPNQADLTIHLASGKTTDIGCGELGTQQTLSCRVGDAVNLNVDRWVFGTPTWSSRPVEEYRGYLVNHEVGHYLGLGHVGCAAQGGPSPVMQQQSIKLDSCQPNPWPSITQERPAI